MTRQESMTLAGHGSSGRSGWQLSYNPLQIDTGISQSSRKPLLPGLTHFMAGLGTDVTKRRAQVTSSMVMEDSAMLVARITSNKTIFYRQYINQVRLPSSKKGWPWQALLVRGGRPPSAHSSAPSTAKYSHHAADSCVASPFC